MDSSLMISISGVRGIVGKSLTPDVISGFAMAFGTFSRGGTLAIGRDTRQSGEMVRHAVISGLIGTGCTVIDLGICPTPTVLYNVGKLNLDGGIAITASHNPEEWNALKFIGSDAAFLNKGDGNKVMAYYLGKKAKAMPWNMQGSLVRDDAGIQRHIEAILALPYVSAAKIRKRKFRVAIDCCNGAGYEAFPNLLRSLGCEVIPVFCEGKGDFKRNPEPVAGNLEMLCRTVRKTRADIGFATDADGDRLSIVDNRAEALGEEFSLPLAMSLILSKKKGNVVCNLSTSLMTDFVAKRFRCRLYKAAVGEANIVKKMRNVNAVVGGEGNGGIILPGLQFTRDGLLGMALVLQLMWESKKTISELKGELPKFWILKKRITVGRKTINYKRIISKLPAGKANRTDGLRIDWKDSWIHVRKSGTEPIVRVIAEARTSKKAQELCGKVMGMIG